MFDDADPGVLRKVLGERQRCGPEDILGVDCCAVLDQKLNHGVRPRLRGAMNGRIAIVVGRIDVRSQLQDEFDRFQRLTLR